MRGNLIELAQMMSTQVDPNQGTMRAMKGAQQRMLEPSLYDAIFPVIAFSLVIVVPTLVALWVIWKTTTEKTLGEGES